MKRAKLTAHQIPALSLFADSNSNRKIPAYNSLKIVSYPSLRVTSPTLIKSQRPS